MTEITKKINKRMKGVVVSNKMKDTVVVSASRYVKHPKYKKYQVVRKKFVAHDPGNMKQVGDKIVIEETNPISKTKRFKVVS